MPIATTGLILRQIKVGEADRILTILTPDLGVISASAKGSMRLKNKLFSATGLFCYSEFSLTSGRNHYFIDTAQIKNVFHGISATVEGMGLASYMAEIAAELSPAPPESEAQLRLLLNCLYMLSEQKRPVRMLKVIYELRSMTLAGYMPDVLACSGCGKCINGRLNFISLKKSSFPKSGNCSSYGCGLQNPVDHKENDRGWKSLGPSV